MNAKVIKDCWDDLAAFDCQYGAHIFDGKDAYIYVNNWLGAFGDVEREFHRRNDEDFVGHCILVFKSIKRFDFDVKLYTKIGDSVSWGATISFNYTGDAQDVKAYELAGSLHGFASSVSISIEAHEFELHILEIDEPARQS
ncbi:hypothetical protein [Burkholderia stagnalis]|uniref:Uncharacterized protein n=1 Tax=Burkholderia stagnalis TaxID=1503054 RepID=A0ABX9YEG0_9BURK|nr:hypothetical protein [Burkholderia stagnalis]RQQ44039.1 hypothetical protein DF158_36115 [Burkholderia stagnalis]RQQ57765.1 hypothetical protein DF137_36130 [Burkholderia stagnalis]RQQ57878.1 hypothetical protein DF139_36000 [Burkholderia stagnalis]RQQ70937.1 hypothetical protein DF138_36215 [Burkholderia stagnalis]RQQ77751.1 hypothetical protein DF134_36555 [Burkholderia stagnalis]